MTLKRLKLESELHRITAARLESEARIMEREEEILKIRESVVLQTQHEEKLTKQLEELKGLENGN